MLDGIFWLFEVNHEHAVADPSLPLVGASEVDRNEDRINRKRCQGTPCAAGAESGSACEHIPRLEEIYTRWCPPSYVCWFIIPI